MDIENTLKKCYYCKTEKERNDFRKNRSKKDGLSSACKKCSDFLKNQKIKENQEFVFQYLKLSSCVDCGNKDPVVLDFDHIHGEKRMSISKMIYKIRSRRKIIDEIDKCTIRCANCHRIKTAKDYGYFRFQKSQENK
jgi:hypothetical protein